MPRKAFTTSVRVQFFRSLGGVFVIHPVLYLHKALIPKAHYPGTLLATEDDEPLGGLKRKQVRREEGRMEGLYYKVIWGILLFPWSLAGLMVLGALRHHRRKAHARVQSRP